MLSAPPVSAPPSPRTLVPREHGAYGQLAMPLLTALALGRPSAASLALTASIALGFVAHEPLLVALGHRGKRAFEADAPRARRLLLALGAAAALSGALGVALAPATARRALAVPAALAMAVASLVARKREKTIPGEMLVAATLSACALPVALAGGAPLRGAVAACVTWALAFAAATLAVQVVLVRARSKGRRDPGPTYAAVAAALLAAAFSAVPLAGLPIAAPLALAPSALLS